MRNLIEILPTLALIATGLSGLEKVPVSVLKYSDGARNEPCVVSLD